MNADKVIFPIHKELAFEQCTFNKTHFSIVTKCLQMNTHRVICKFIKNCRFNVISIKLILVFFTKCLEMNADRVIFFSS